MQIVITHASYADANKAALQLVELGAMTNGKVLWRSTIAETIARIHAGIRFFVIHDGEYIAVEIVPATALRDAYLRTGADKMTFDLLRHLPQLPKAQGSLLSW
ncbi:hypothetical protein J2W34_000722 [Variovorax boronicumulans]|uniref:hypothetical protein n=1 Tax=Variovorax boronicumulans TaxID=436515 RepID=UPI002782FF33|nr:hypothetical protein [Variovorax boronicumulans]MDQ0068948.1 hypothetical protein [Variovorax boronicumulans]